ncbi:MAG TPA: glycoside hydrolase family 3 N-terminal domain-containing protein [Cytophagaceae bacterium]|jgi:beta-N-acetylhexosaminidase|nr:glycoside hydrolase family 3 N-terminal domain-containing protein [Cytophagaceae bacterium]
MRIIIFIIAFLCLMGCKAKLPLTTATVVKEKELKKDSIVAPKSVLIPVQKPKDQFDLNFKIGQMILVGINKRTSLSETDSLRKEIAEGKMGGFIFFEKNISSTNAKENLKKLILDLQSRARIPLFMSIDEEGGKVHRLKEKYGFLPMPSAAYLGKTNNTDSTFYYTSKLASIMAEVGLNVNFAPDVDVALNPNNPVIAKVDRSYSAIPEEVSRHAIANIKAQHVYGVKTVLKHFPGHGSSMTDSHLGITNVTKQWSFVELIPYKDIIKSGNCDAIMTAHIVNCRLDTTCLPATLSKVVVTDILRNILDFKGVVFSDDMQMFAISKNYGLENAIKMSILAGVDVLVFGNNVNASDRITASEIHAIITKLVKSGEISESRITESFERIMVLKEKKVN